MNARTKLAASMTVLSGALLAGTALAQTTGTGGTTDTDDTPGLPDTGGGWAQSR